MIVYERTTNSFDEVSGDLHTAELTIPQSNLSIWNVDELAAHNCYRIDFPVIPEGKVQQSYTVARVDGVVQIVPVYQDIPPLTKAQCLDALAARRFIGEEAGTTLANGTPIATDRTTQAKVTGAYVKAKADSTYSISNWKMGPGVFITLDNATIIAVGDAIATHVQACFDHEAGLSAQIAAATVPGSIDINSGWPA